MTTLDAVLLVILIILGALVLLSLGAVSCAFDEIKKLENSIYRMEQDNRDKHIEQYNRYVEYINGIYKSLDTMGKIIDNQTIDIENLKDNKIDKSYEDIELEEVERYCPIIDKAVQYRLDSMKRD